MARCLPRWRDAGAAPMWPLSSDSAHGAAVTFAALDVMVFVLFLHIPKTPIGLWPATPSRQWW
uniref:Uncharacterized protein n=1 Tax=Oryza meridionalis TaxID=40149 RepID=A0A0E0F8S4_9ORYZ